MKARAFALSGVAGLMIGLVFGIASSAWGLFSVDDVPTEVPVDPGDVYDWGLVVVMDDGDGPPAPVNLMVPDPLNFNLNALTLEAPDDPFFPPDGAMPGLLISFDDGFPGAGSGPPDRAVELFFVDILNQMGGGWSRVWETNARESFFPLGTDPGPRPADDDVNAYEARSIEAGVPVILFSADTPKDGGLGHPGVIFRGGMGGPPVAVARPSDLGLDDRVNINALASVQFHGHPHCPQHLHGEKGVLFSVDARMPGGLMPGDIYFSNLKGTHELLFPLYGDRRDIDAISVNAIGQIVPTVPDEEPSCAKWERPPDTVNGVNLWSYHVPGVMGKDDYSLIADDFVSDGRPITDVHWWGSYRGWMQDMPYEPPWIPPVTPDGFLLRWYEDVPAGADPDFPHSHPGAVLGEVFAPYDKVGQTYYATVKRDWIEQGMVVYEHEYAYSFDLPEPWFEEAGRVYWLSVQAIFYPDAGQHPEFRPWGWTTTSPVYGWNDAAVLTFTEGGIWEERLVYPTPFYPPTHPHTGLRVDMAFALTTRDCPPPDCPKWQRHVDLDAGIDAESWIEEEMPPAAGTLLADDFISDGRPIHMIEWHGSYPGWMTEEPHPQGVLPRIQPMYFRLGWWTDIPAGADPQVPWSHPGKGIEFVEVPLHAANQAYAGTVYDPRANAYEHKYRYQVRLPEPWREKQGEIYWLSVQAVFPRGASDAKDFVPWGWATTPPWMNWNDNAVRRIDGAEWEALYYRDIAPKHPYSEFSLNLSFSLLTDICPARCTKWSKPADMELGDDWPSWGIRTEVWEPVIVMADDFISDGRLISDIHWWGSYIDWAATAPAPPGPPPVRPLGFRLRMYEDVPAGGGTKWSHPGALILETFCPIAEANEVYYGTVAQFWKGGRFYEHEYQYYCDLKHPWPEREGGIYWLEIVAFFDWRDAQQPDFHPWGWKSTPVEHHWNDAAVIMEDPRSPWQPVAWYQGHPREGEPVDLAFELTTKEFVAPKPICKGNVVSIRPWMPNPDWILLRWMDVAGCGSAHVVQRSPVPDPLGPWQNIHTNVAPVLANSFVDMLPAGTARQFYRVQILE